MHCYSFLWPVMLNYKIFCHVRNAKTGDLPEHKFEVDIELEGKAEEVCVD